MEKAGIVKKIDIECREISGGIALMNQWEKLGLFQGGVSIFIRVGEKIEWRQKGPDAEEWDMICGLNF